MSSKSNKKDIKIVSGNANDLEISPVSSYIPASKPKTSKKTNKKIVIPNEKKKKEE